VKTPAQDSPRRSDAARRTLDRVALDHYTSLRSSTRQERSLETHGPFGTLWVGLGLGCFYIALIWVNTLLGFFLTPLFVIPATWLMDRLASARNQQ
jgi:hypothetical protein